MRCVPIEAILVLLLIVHQAVVVYLVVFVFFTRKNQCLLGAV